jgi:histidine triad (HIT) family protein
MSEASTVGASSPQCLFCRIVAGEIPATIVRESPGTLAFRDIGPQAPTHVLIVPKAHYPAVAALAEDAELLAEVVSEAHAVAVDEGVAESGYRVLFNTGPDAGQTVHHVHAHVLGGRALGHLG